MGPSLPLGLGSRSPPADLSSLLGGRDGRPPRWTDTPSRCWSYATDRRGADPDPLSRPDAPLRASANGFATRGMRGLENPRESARPRSGARDGCFVAGAITTVRDLRDDRISGEAVVRRVIPERLQLNARELRAGWTTGCR